MGSSPMVRGDPHLGHVIEACPFHVVRLNTQPTEGHETYVGTKTTLRVINRNVAEQHADALSRAARIESLPGLVLLCAPPCASCSVPWQADGEGTADIVKTAATLNIYPAEAPPDVPEWPSFPTTGLCTIAFLLSWTPQVWIHGFSFESTHYFEENMEPCRHDYAAERRVIDGWCATGRVCWLADLHRCTPKVQLKEMGTFKDVGDVCFIIQARLGSQRCRKKMLRPFGDTTLIDIALDKVLQSTIIPREQFYFAVGETELAVKAEERGLNVFWRSAESVSAEADITSIYEWHDKLPFKWWVMINACQPFLKVSTIDAFIQDFLSSPESVSGSFGVLRKKNYFWSADHCLVTPWPVGQTILNTKAVEESYEAAHSLYAGRMADVAHGIHMGTFSGLGDPRLFVLPDALEVWDIDYEWEWLAALKLRENTAEEGGLPGLVKVLPEGPVGLHLCSGAAPVGCFSAPSLRHVC